MGLILKEAHGGVIELTDFGRKVADRQISQTEFAAVTIQTLTLPNPAVQSDEECRLWRDHGYQAYDFTIIGLMTLRLAG